MTTNEGTTVPGSHRYAIVASRYHDFITGRLEAGALAAFESAGISASDVTVVRVPGAFELPLAARMAAATERFAAVVCLGCLIRGGTPHFEFIAAAVANGLMAAAGETRVPITFGVLTTNSVEEALERAADGPSNKGWEAAAAAIEMTAALRALVS